MNACTNWAVCCSGALQRGCVRNLLPSTALHEFPCLMCSSSVSCYGPTLAVPPTLHHHAHRSSYRHNAYQMLPPRPHTTGGSGSGGSPSGGGDRGRGGDSSPTRDGGGFMLSVGWVLRVRFRCCCQDWRVWCRHHVDLSGRGTKLCALPSSHSLLFRHPVQASQSAASLRASTPASHALRGSASAALLGV